MQQASRRITSGQSGIHPRLAKLIQRYSQTSWQKPAQAVDQPALHQLDEVLNGQHPPIVLDSFCGTGHSTVTLAERYPHALIIGVDKSAHRLGRGPAQPDNCLFLQAHCEAVWRHLHTRQVRLLAHYALYPNPWPKPAQLQRRIHGHPAFPLLPKLGGIIELRSNWQVYVEEFGVALHLLGVPSRIALVQELEAPLTLFERKYRDSGHELWSLHADLSKVPTPVTTRSA